MTEISKAKTQDIVLPDADDWPSIQKWRKAKRELLIKARLGIGSEQRKRTLEIVNSRLSSILADISVGTIGFYWPIKGEFDLRKLVENSIAQGWKAALPVVDKPATPLQFCSWTPTTKLVPGVWNIPVPEQRDLVIPSLLLVPLVGFDQSNYRLGYGGGYYDRTIASFKKRPHIIGLGLEICQLNTIYPQWHDIPMDEIISVDSTSAD